MGRVKNYMNFAKIFVHCCPPVTTTLTTLFDIMNTVKALLSPQGAYLISNTPYGGLKERRLSIEGTYPQNKRTYVTAFQFFYLIFNGNFTSQIHKIRQSCIPSHIKTKM